jgi:hypothetical protein
VPHGAQRAAAAGLRGCSPDRKERAERRRLAPLVQQLRAKQVRLRWKGAKLEQQVARAGGGKQWREVDPLPPAPAEDAAGQMAGGGAGEGQ